MDVQCRFRRTRCTDVHLNAGIRHEGLRYITLYITVSYVVRMKVYRERHTGNVVKPACCIWMEAGPDMSLGTANEKFSNVVRPLPIAPWLLY